MFDPSSRVRDGEPLHESREIAIALRLKHQMKMIRHETPIEDSHRRAFERVHDAAAERCVIAGSTEEVHLSDAAIEDVEYHPAGSDACNARHEKYCKRG